MKLLIATSNPHKLEEIRAVLTACGLALDLAGLADLPAIDEPVEDAATFEGNAIKKAQHYAAATNLPCLADDSGLEVDALGGEPGVRSARYAGVTGARSVVDPANNQLLLERLGETPLAQRTARFVCAMALSAPHLLVRGTIEGRILLPGECEDPTHPERGRGRNGFGYDPLFLVPSLGKTTAQITPQHKNAISHRGQATRLMAEQLKHLGWR